MRFFEDVRYAARQLTHARGLTVVAVPTLAIGIGAALGPAVRAAGVDPNIALREL